MRVSRTMGRQKSTLLTRYGDQLGLLTERHKALAAMQAARQQAERHAHDAEQAAQQLREEATQRTQAQSRLVYLASHDALTGLANRSLLNERLTAEMTSTRHADGQFALLCLDLDRFKDVNDTLGHAAGDLLLQEVARRLTACSREHDVVARLGGDEFAILQFDLDEMRGTRVLAERIIHELHQPVTIAGQRVFTGASVGITIFPEDGRDAESLMRNADMALYKAKHNGRNGYYFFDSTLNDDIFRRASLERALHEALALGQLSVAYQPQVAIANNTLVGVEALLRWRHPEFGNVSPSEFIPVAERNGLINRLGTWVLNEACQQARRWDAAGLPPLKVAVNVAAAQFKGGDVPRLVANILEQTGLPASRLELEITESSVMHDIRDAVQILSALHAQGVSLAIDDFGTGYSSLSYLRRLPVDKIKVDRSFVTDVIHNADAAAIAKTIITLGHNLRLTVVAEGVETAPHARHMHMLACDLGQGYYYGQPATPDQLAGFFRPRRPTENTGSAIPAREELVPANAI